MKKLRRDNIRATPFKSDDFYAHPRIWEPLKQANQWARERLAPDIESALYRGQRLAENTQDRLAALVYSHAQRTMIPNIYGKETYPLFLLAQQASAQGDILKTASIIKYLSEHAKQGNVDIPESDLVGLAVVAVNNAVCDYLSRNDRDMAQPLNKP